MCNQDTKCILHISIKNSKGHHHHITYYTSKLHYIVGNDDDMLIRHA